MGDESKMQDAAAREAGGNTDDLAEVAAAANVETAQHNPDDGRSSGEVERNDQRVTSGANLTEEGENVGTSSDVDLGQLASGEGAPPATIAVDNDHNEGRDPAGAADAFVEPRGTALNDAAVDGAPIGMDDQVGKEHSLLAQAETVHGRPQDEEQSPDNVAAETEMSLAQGLESPGGALNDARPGGHHGVSVGGVGGVGDVSSGNSGNGDNVGPRDSSRNQPASGVPEWPPYCDPTYRMPSDLTVRVVVDGEERSMSIKVERFGDEKRFLGGYRHRGTGRVFHHAASQFGQQELPKRVTEHLRSRDTQTCRIESTTMQTTNECGTQMTRKDMYFDESRDTCKTAGEYQTAAEYWRVRERFTVVIQRFWRGYSARNSVWSRREEKWLKEDEKTKVMAEAESKQARRNQREMERRMNPTSVQDFELLYNELDQWRETETKRIKEAGGGERRQVALRELLHKETRLLQTIDRLKITASREGKERRTRRMLELMSAPKQWEMGDGEVAEIHTPWTTRARELQELYEALEAPLLSVEERLDVLLHLKWTVSEFDCRLTRDIAELVDREADLLSRGRGEASLRPLRRRIRNLFLRFAETPDFNPEATRFVRVPPKYGKLKSGDDVGLTATTVPLKA